MAEPSVFDHLVAPASVADPYSLFRELRENDPYHRLPAGEWGDWVLTRYDDVSSVLRSANFAKPKLPWLPVRSVRVLFRMFLMLNPPDHDRLRKTVARHFTQQGVVEQAPVMAAAAQELLAEASSGFDVMAGLARPLPLMVISDMLGVPSADRGLVAGWSQTLVEGLEAPFPDRLRDSFAFVADRRSRPIRTLQAAVSIVRFAGRVLDANRGLGADAGVLGALVEAEGDGTMSADEAAATWVMMLIAGHETSANLIGNTIWWLGRHPDALAEVTGDPSLIANAVEETLRVEAPVTQSARIAIDDVSVGDVEIRQGEMVRMLLGAANRDPDVYPEPDRFDIHRRQTPTHLGFALGTHFCLGAAFARAETEAAVAALVERFATFEVPAAPDWRPSVALRGLSTLPIVVQVNR